MIATPNYDGFLSYRHSARQMAIVRRLQRGLHRFARPFWKPRSVRTYRDETNLEANPDLWQTISEALDHSRYFLLIASPEAAESKWVRREVEYWVKKNGFDRFIVVVTDGELVWDDENGCYDRAKTTALPELALISIKNEPRHVDLRWVEDPYAQLAMSDPRFVDAVATIAAALKGKSKDEITGDDVREHRRTRLAITAAFVAIVLFALGTVYYAINYASQRNAAIAQRDNAISRSLAARSQLLVSQRGTLIDTASLLAVESMKMAPSLEADQAIRKVLWLIPKRAAEIHCASKGNVKEGVFSKEGSYLATTSVDNTTQVLDTKTGQLLTKIPMHTGQRVTFRPSFHELISLNSGRVSIWNSDDAHLIKTLPYAHVNSFNYSTDGVFLVLVMSDKTTRVLDATDYTEFARMQNQGEMTAVAVAPGAREIIASNENGSEVFRSPGPPSQVLPSTGGLETFTYSPDGNYLTRQTPNLYLVSLLDTRSEQSLLFADRHSATAFSGNSQAMGIGSPEWDATVYDLSTCNRAGLRMEPTGGGMLKRTYASGRGSCMALSTVHHDDSITDLDLSWDGTLLATTSRDRTLRVWETARGREVLRIREDSEDEIRGVTFSPDAKYLSAWGPKGCHTWESSGHRQIAALEHDDEITGIGFSGDGTKVATVDMTPDFRSPNVRVWTVPGGQEVGRLEVTPLSQHSVALDDNGTKMLLDNASVWQVSPKKQAYTLALPIGIPSPARGPSLNSDWKTGAVAADPNTVIVYDTQNGKELARRRTPDRPMETLALAPDGCCVAVAMTGGNLVLWRWAKNKEELFSGLAPKSSKLVFDRAGSSVAVIGGEQRTTVQVLRLGRRMPPILLVHETQVNDAAFDSTGHFLATAGEDKMARIWNVEAGTLIAQLSHDADVRSIAFSPNDKYVLSGGGRSDRTGRLWLWRPGDLIDEACSRLRRKSLTGDEWERYIGAAPYRETCTRETRQQ
jgi:WD40 repeat protein